MRVVKAEKNVVIPPSSRGFVPVAYEAIPEEREYMILSSRIEIDDS